MKLALSKSAGQAIHSLVEPRLMAKNRILIVEDDASVRRVRPVQDFGVPVYAHRHITHPARVLLSPRTRQPADLTATRLRAAAAIAVTLLIAFGAGAAM